MLNLRTNNPADEKLRAQHLQTVLDSGITTDNLKKLADVVIAAGDVNAAVPKIEKALKNPLVKAMLK